MHKQQLLLVNAPEQVTTKNHDSVFAIHAAHWNKANDDDFCHTLSLVHRPQYLKISQSATGSNSLKENESDEYAYMGWKIPEQVWQCAQVIELNLANNGIFNMKPIAQHLEASMKNLQELNISNNQLVELPKELAALEFLKKLDCSQNALAVIASEIFVGCCKIRILNVEQNNLSTLPDTLGKLNYLTMFHAAHNKLDSFPAALTSCIKLEHIDVTNNTIQKPLPKQFGALVNLDTLYLARNLLKDEDLPLELDKCAALRHVDLSMNLFRNLPSVLPSSVISIKMENNKHLIKATISKKMGFSLRVLDMSRTSIASLGDDAAYVAMTLNTLDLSYCDILVQFPMVITKLKQLARLNLSYTKIATIPEQIKDNQELVSLNLRHCTELTKLPFKSLIALPKLAELQLFGCTKLKDPPQSIVEYEFSVLVPYFKGLLSARDVLKIPHPRAGKKVAMPYFETTSIADDFEFVDHHTKLLTSFPELLHHSRTHVLVDKRGEPFDHLVEDLYWYELKHGYQIPGYEHLK